MVAVWPTALLLPLALVPIIADYLLHCQLLLIWQCSDCKAGFLSPTWNLWEGRIGKRRAMRIFRWTNLGTAGFGSHCILAHTALLLQVAASSCLCWGPLQAKEAHWFCLCSGISLSLHSRLHMDWGKDMAVVSVLGFALLHSPTPVHDCTHSAQQRVKTS